jgi:predicted nucleic acid-binding Zn ribbon protein
MPRSNDQSLGDAIRQFLHSYHLEDKLNEARIIQSWEKTVGPMVAKYTRELHIRNGILFVSVDSPALRQELNFQRSRLVKALNDEAKATVIEDIVLK